MFLCPSNGFIYREDFYPALRVDIVLVSEIALSRLQNFVFEAVYIEILERC